MEGGLISIEASTKEGKTQQQNVTCAYVYVLQLHIQYLCGTCFVTGSGLSTGRYKRSKFFFPISKFKEIIKMYVGVPPKSF